MNKSDTFDVALFVAGERACFRRPEFTTDLVSYDVMPPFVAQQILSSIYLPGDATWTVSRIHVLSPIRFKVDQIINARGPRRALVLTDVAYVIEASAGCHPSGLPQHERSFAQAVAAKACVHLGLPSLPATVRLAANSDVRTDMVRPELHDLGWMMRDLRDPETKLPTFFRAQLVNGCVKVRDPRLTAS